MGWDPWRALGEQPEIELMVAELPGGALGLSAIDGPHRAILLDQHLSSAELRSALAHELVHLERGGGAHHPGAPRSWSAVVAREERHVDDIVAARLVPRDELAPFVDARAEIDPITPALVAAEFDVTEAVARRALEHLAGSLSADGSTRDDPTSDGPTRDRRDRRRPPSALASRGPGTR